jgi:hemoglobin-like flavoprotein
MNLTPHEIELIKVSFKTISENAVNFAGHFYDSLFELAPIVKPMFASERDVIELHFVEIMATAVEKIESFDELEPALLELGAIHKKHKVIASQFDFVKTALILAIEYELREKCNNAVISAWSHYIDEISAVMIRGLKQ